MNTLKLIVSEAGSFASTNFVKYDYLIEKAGIEGHYVTILAGAYLHGKLEHEMGYDICAILNGEECIKDEKYIEGIYDVEVEDYPNKCKAFLWNKSGPRGLVVDINDSDAMKYAEECYNDKLSCL